MVRSRCLYVLFYYVHRVYMNSSRSSFFKFLLLLCFVPIVHCTVDIPRYSISILDGTYMQLIMQEYNDVEQVRAKRKL